MIKTCFGNIFEPTAFGLSRITTCLWVGPEFSCLLSRKKPTPGAQPESDITGWNFWRNFGTRGLGKMTYRPPGKLSSVSRTNYLE